MATQAMVDFKEGDFVQLIGGVTSLIVMRVLGDTVYCTPLPYRFGDPVVPIKAHQLRRSESAFASERASFGTAELKAY